MKKTQYLRKEIIKKACQGIILLITAFALGGAMPKLSAVNASELQATDLERIQIGKAVPDFNLESVDGNWVRLSNYQNRKNVILVFYRGYW
jgi:cytochrome oxidase Cu insertion factor (SCO1/SenC/PrrC family)